MAALAPEPHFRATLPFTPEAPSAARNLLRRFTSELTHAIVDDAVVMVSELATNAFQHGKPVITLQLWLTPECLTVAVADHGEAHVPLERPLPELHQLGGRGLHIVDALAAHWGVRSNGGVGKSVWFDLAAS